MANKKILEFIRKYTISASSLTSISANLHDKKKLSDLKDEGIITEDEFNLK